MQRSSGMPVAGAHLLSLKLRRRPPLLLLERRPLLSAPLQPLPLIARTHFLPLPLQLQHARLEFGVPAAGAGAAAPPAPAAPSLRAPQRRAAYRRRPAQATAAEAGGGPPVPSAAEAEAAAGTSGQAVGVAECGCWHQRCPSFGGATLVMGASSEETCGPRAGHMQASLGQHMRITVSHTDGRYRLAWRRTATWGVIGLVCTAPRERVAPQRKRSCRAAAMTAAAFSAPGANGALAPPLLTSCMPARADGRVEWRRGHRPGGSPRAAGREGREVDANGDAKQADCGAHLRNS